MMPEQVEACSKKNSNGVFEKNKYFWLQFNQETSINSQGISLYNQFVQKTESFGLNSYFLDVSIVYLNF